MKCTHLQLLKNLFLPFLLLFLLTSCGSECYDERDYKAKFAEMQNNGVQLCAEKGMKHLSTNLISIEDEWLVSCYTSSPPKTYGFKIEG